MFEHNVYFSQMAIVNGGAWLCNLGRGVVGCRTGDGCQFQISNYASKNLPIVGTPVSGTGTRILWPPKPDP